MNVLPVSISDWLHVYRQEGQNPRALLGAVLERISAKDTAWISLCSETELNAQLLRLEAPGANELPLFGVPFAIKDNIDVQGWVTTAACPAFAYEASATAIVVQRLQAAGAVVIGKTNLDQFATGLVGARSPYGKVPNTFDNAYVSGGSSSGSASVVARGLVPFALGTDTAGSGRVPAGLNNIVGFKPTPGSVPMQGVLPACRTLDVVSIFALSTDDASLVLALMQQGEAKEPIFHTSVLQPAWLGTCSRRVRIGIPMTPDCDEALGYAAAFEEAVARLGSLDVEVLAVDMDVLHDVARLLYDGPWVAERYGVVKQLLNRHPQALDPTVAEVITRAKGFDACEAFEARYELAALSKTAQAIWSTVDTLMVPTTPTCPTFEALAEQPILRNSELGKYTNFVNLLGWSALSLPASISKSGLPFGITFIAPGGADAALADWGRRWEGVTDLLAGHELATFRQDRTQSYTKLAAEPCLQLAVVGAHLQGLALHWQLVDRRCRLLQRTHTAPHYRLYALAGTQPAKPGLIRHSSGGASIAVEVYEMPASAVGSFLQAIPYPLGLGNLELQDGKWVKGFICEPAGLENAQDITAYGGWREFLDREVK